MSVTPRDRDRTVPQNNGRFIAKWLTVVLGAPALAALGYLCLAIWFVVLQRDFQYTPGGSRLDYFMRALAANLAKDGGELVRIPLPQT